MIFIHIKRLFGTRSQCISWGYFITKGEVGLQGNCWSLAENLDKFMIRNISSINLLTTANIWRWNQVMVNFVAADALVLKHQASTDTVYWFSTYFTTPRILQEIVTLGWLNLGCKFNFKEKKWPSHFRINIKTLWKNINIIMRTSCSSYKSACLCKIQNINNWRIISQI